MKTYLVTIENGGNFQINANDLKDAKRIAQFNKRHEYPKGGKTEVRLKR